jgi:hypothetical protein
MERRFNPSNHADYPPYSNSYYDDEYPPPYIQEERQTEQGRGQQEQETQEGKGKGAMAWLQRVSGSREFQFGATALVSGAVVAGAILGYQHVRRQERVEDLKSSIPALGDGHLGDKVC